MKFWNNKPGRYLFYHSNWIDRLVALEAGGHYHPPGRGHYLYRNLGREKYDF